MVSIDVVTLDKLRSFDTPTICNLIELFDVRPRDAGYMDDRIKACFPEMPPLKEIGRLGGDHRTARPPREAEEAGVAPEQPRLLGAGDDEGGDHADDRDAVGHDRRDLAAHHPRRRHPHQRRLR